MANRNPYYLDKKEGRMYTFERIYMEAARMVGIGMYAEIQKQRAARELNVDTKMVRKYRDMAEEEYIKQQYESKERGKNMDPYREYVLDKLREHSEITSAIIYDNLREEFADFEPSYRSVRRYVLMLRETEGLPAPVRIRQYMEVKSCRQDFRHRWIFSRS